MNLLAFVGEVSDGFLCFVRSPDFRSHALGDVVAEYPDLCAFGHKNHVHEHGCVVIMTIAVIHELRKIQVRSKRKTAAVNGESAIPLGIGDVLFLVAACIRRADIHERTESCLVLFILFDVRSVHRRC